LNCFYHGTIELIDNYFTQMARIFDNVLESICNILSFECKDDILLNKWACELEWFVTFDKEKSIKYWNIAPEVIEHTKWLRLHEVLNNLIPNSNPVHVWEKKIVNIFLDKNEYDETSFTEENPSSTNTHENSVDVEWYNATATTEDYLSSDDEKEQRWLARIERDNASNHEDISYRYYTFY
jgi:hypothetical protein